MLGGILDQPHRRRTRTRREWLEIQRNLVDLTDYEKKVIDYALRRVDHFPRPEFEVKRIIEDNVQNKTVVENNSNILDFSVGELIQQQNQECNLDCLSKGPVAAIEALDDFKKRNALDQID